MKILDFTKPCSTDDLLDVLNDMIYANYKYNRRRSPDLRPEQWAPVFPAWERYERRYQNEQGVNDA